MSTAIVIGAHGLLGSESVARFCEMGFDVIGIDNDMRARFFGPEASTRWQGERLRSAYPKYRSHSADIRDALAIERIFTLNLLECTRLHAPKATFIFTSTNKVYGDRPNQWPLAE